MLIHVVIIDGDIHKFSGFTIEDGA